jgi:hypothetical protein
MKYHTLLLCGALLIVGCQNEGCDVATRCPSVWDSDPIDPVVDAYNTNASRVPRLWSYARAAMTLREKPGDLPFSWGSTSDLAEPNARIILAKGDDPAAVPDFLMIFKEAGQEVARLGVSRADNVYYMWAKFGDRRFCRFGRLDLAGAPGIEHLPIDPTQVIAALAISPMPLQRATPPFATRSYTTDPCAYVLTAIDRQPITGRMLFRRRLLIDRREGTPHRPIGLDVFDEQGRAVLTATMDDDQPITLEDVDDAGAQPPVMPTAIRLSLLRSGSGLELKLNGMTTADRVDPEAFEFFANLPPALKTVAEPVDAHLVRSGS